MSMFDLCWINVSISIYSSNEIDFNVKYGVCHILSGDYFIFEMSFYLYICSFIPLLRAKMNLTCTYVFSESIKISCAEK